jgi:malate dehydrogenase (oxaloacetate-decarboxylating)
MCLAAAGELARCAEEKGIHEEYIAPLMDDWEVFPREAAAVAMKAQEQGVARVAASHDELYASAARTIKAAREQIEMLMREKFIPPVPEA